MTSYNLTCLLVYENLIATLIVQTSRRNETVMKSKRWNLSGKLVDVILQSRLQTSSWDNEGFLFLWCHFEKKKTGRKNKGLQTKINHGNWAIFALSIAFLSISVRVDRCTFISMFSRSYTHALYISKCSTFANDKYIIAHITARHICESLL